MESERPEYLTQDELGSASGLEDFLHHLYSHYCLLFRRYEHACQDSIYICNGSSP